MSRSDPIQLLVKCLSGLPGIGEKTAIRLALHIVNCPKDDALQLARSIIDVRERVRLCRQCFNYTDSDLCVICSIPGRNTGDLCVVENPGDIISIERTGSFCGQYHVLHGVISPPEGIGPDQLNIGALLQRAGGCNIQEVIIATNPTVNGNATAAYISDKLNMLKIKNTRIAQGMPSGGDIGYADQLTLKNAIDGRSEMK